MIDATVIFHAGLRDPGEAGAIDGAGRLQVLPADFWRQYSQSEIAVFCHKHGIYCVPTTELVAYLKIVIGDRKAIEIGSGNGVLAAALGIPATDNRLQERPDIQQAYAGIGHPVIRYGDNVAHLDAQVAVDRARPQLVLAAWVTHKWNPKAHWRGGNMYGVNEAKIVKKADYLFIGHEHTHRLKPLMERDHDIIYPEWLVSRAMKEGRDFIAIWPKE